MNALEVFGSFEKAAELTNEPYTGCTLVSNTKRHVALSPKYIGRLRTGVGEVLDAELGRFSESLRGVLLAYGSVKLLQSSGAIVDDSPFIHFDIKFDAVVFNPKRGSLLKCVVIEQASDHVGCLVHDWFNVSLLASRKELSGQKQPKLEPGYVVLVQVECLRSLNGMLAIEARAPDDGSDLILEAVSKDTDSESNVDSVLQSSLSDTPDAATVSSGTAGNEASSKKKKKHAKAKLDEVDSLQPSLSDTGDVTTLSTVGAGTEASGKKKKKKRVKEENEEVDSFQPSVSDFVDSTGAEAKSEKKKRKHKNVKQELDVDSLDGSNASRTAGEEARSRKKKVKQELDVDSLQPSIHLETKTGEETAKHKKSKKRKLLETANDNCTDFTAELTTGEQTSPKKKKKKKLKKETAEPDSESLTNHSDYPITQITTGEKTNSTKKKKKKDRETRAGVDLYQLSCLPNGPTAATLEVKVEANSQDSSVEDVVSNLLPLFNEQSPEKKRFTKLKKHKDAKTDCSPEPVSSAKKHKKKVKRENIEHDAHGVNSLTVKQEPGTESNGVSQSASTPGSDTEVRGQKSHKKHKRKGAEIDDSLSGGSKKKKKKKDR